MPERWTRAVLRLRFAVLALWLLVLVVGGWSYARLPDLLSNSFAVPGTESDRAGKLLEQHFDERPDGLFVVVFRVARPSDERVRERLEERVAEVARVVPTGRLGRTGTGGGVVWAELTTRLDLQEAKLHTDAVRAAFRGQAGPAPLVTGQPAIQHDLDPVFASDLRRGEALALPIALLVLVAVLGLSAAVALPFVVAACTIAATSAVVYGLAHAFPMGSYVKNLVELMGLALAIDYSLLIVHRFREEAARGGPTDDAVVRTMATAGRAVTVSGLAVAIGLGLLVLVPVPLLRSMGVGGLLIPLLSVAAALTLQPALLSLLGTRGRRRRPERADGTWARLARAIVRRPVAIIVAVVAVLLATAAPLPSLDLDPGSIARLPQEPEAMRGFAVLGDSVGQGIVTPTHVVLDTGRSGGAADTATRAAVARLAGRLARDPDVLLVASGRRPPYVDPSRRYARVIVATRYEYGAERTRRFVERLRERHVPSARLPAGTLAVAGGAPPQGVDFLDRTYAAFPWVVAGVLLLTYVVLLRAFRSLLLPLQAVVVNLLSVGAVYGLLALAFGEVEGWVPVLLFAALVGLSMDYEVFVVARMREAWDETRETATAVVIGLERTGRVVTAAAVIMVAAFSGFFLGRVDALQQFGLGLALAVLLDATLVRVLLVPSAVTVLGRWNWWLPERVARLARVAPSPLREKP